MKKLFTMEFKTAEEVWLYEDGRTCCAILDSVEAAKARARELTPSGYKLELLRAQ